MSQFKLTIVSLLVAQAIATYAGAATHTVSMDGVIGKDVVVMGNDSLNADIAHSFNSGTTTLFTGNSKLLASAAQAISAGVQNFKDASYLQVTAANAINGGRQNFYDHSYIELAGADLLGNNLAFNLADADTRLIVAGQHAQLGVLEGKGQVSNNSNSDGTLALDTGKWGSSSFAGVLTNGTGTGKLNLLKLGAGEWIYNGDGSAMTGTTTVNGGQLTVNGDLSQSSVTVNRDGTLAGSGSVGAVKVNAGGVLGTEKITDRLKVNGDLSFAKLGTYYANLGAGGQAGRVEVKGQADLNVASLYVTASADSYAANTRYTILTADGGITDRFDYVRSSLYFLTPKLTYNANSVELELTRNQRAIASVARSASATNLANSLENRDNTLVNHVLTSDEHTAAAALEQLAGAASASRAAAMLASNAQVGYGMLKAMEQRDSRGNSLQSAALRSDGPLPVSNAVPGANGQVWLQGLGSQGSFEGTEHAANMQQRTQGALLGADWAVGEAWRAGVVGGYGKTDLDAGDYLGDAVTSYHLG
ncbi:MAG: autotransporter domain-containing protein, partial [Pseudomonas sp.]